MARPTIFEKSYTCWMNRMSHILWIYLLPMEDRTIDGASWNTSSSQQSASFSVSEHLLLWQRAVRGKSFKSWLIKKIFLTNEYLIFQGRALLFIQSTTLSLPTALLILQFLFFPYCLFSCNQLIFGLYPKKSDWKVSFVWFHSHVLELFSNF